MNKVEYSRAMSDVLAILSNTDIDLVKKIPNSFMKFLRENQDKNYVTNIDITKPIEMQKLDRKTKTLLSLIYVKYFCDVKQKNEISKKINTNEIEYSRKLNENMFLNREKNREKTNENLSLVEVKTENFFVRIINKIKNIFRKR